MIEIAFSSSFKRACKKRVKGQVELEEKFRQRIEIFMQNLFDGRLSKDSQALRQIERFMGL